MTKNQKVIDMEQISSHEIQTNLTTIFDRINDNHEVMKVVRNQTQSVVLLNANDYNSPSSLSEKSFVALEGI